jgi:hypothetical protein
MNPRCTAVTAVVLAAALGLPQAGDHGLGALGVAWAEGRRDRRGTEKAPGPTRRPRLPPPTATPGTPVDAVAPAKPIESEAAPIEPHAPGPLTPVPMPAPPAGGVGGAAALQLDHLTELQFRALPDSALIEVDGQVSTKRTFLERLGQQQAVAVAEGRTRIKRLQASGAARRAEFLAREKAGLEAWNATVRAELSRLRQAASGPSTNASTTPELASTLAVAPEPGVKYEPGPIAGIPPPTIDDIDGTIQPGAEILIKGSGFGAAAGTAALILRNPVFGDKVVAIRPAEWKNTYLHGTVADVIGLPDGLGTIQVVTPDGRASNLFSVSFRARRAWIKLPARDIDGDCSRTSAKDFCQGKGERITECWGPGIKFPGPGHDADSSSFYAEHASHSCTRCDGGADRFGATLKNGWTFADMGWWWNMPSTRLGRSSLEEPKGFVTGATAASLEVQWKTGSCSWVQYGVDLHITGPDGVPYR